MLNIFYEAAAEIWKLQPKIIAH